MVRIPQEKPWEITLLTDKWPILYLWRERENEASSVALGVAEGDVFHKWSKAKLENHDSFGENEKALEYMLVKGIKWYTLPTEKGAKLTVPLDRFFTQGFPVDYGWGRQLHLHVKDWNRET